MKCTNADWPDSYGHYREAKFTQIKHHWWWKANQIFDKLDVTTNFDGKSLYKYSKYDSIHILVF